MNDYKRYYQQSYQQMIIVHFLYKLEYQAELIKEENPSELKIYNTSYTKSTS